MSQTAPGFYTKNHPRNPLLLRDDVGRGKYSAYNLPQIHYTYGRPLERDIEGAKEVSMTWKYHQETRDKEPDRDFAKLNKMSLTTGLHTSSDFSSFRREVDARVKVPKGRNALPLYIPEEQFSYGVPNRPSTPIKQVIGNMYGLESIQLRQQEEEWRSQTRILPKGNKASDLNYTCTQQKLQAISQFHNKDLFKLTKFKKVQPRTNTYLHKNASDIGLKSQIPNGSSNENNNNNNQVQGEVPNQAVE